MLRSFGTRTPKFLTTIHFYYSGTCTITVFYLQVDVVLPLDPEEAFPDNEEAQEIWQKYVDAQCPRLSAGNDFTYNSRI